MNPTDVLVKQYLIMKGYTDAAAAMEHTAVTAPPQPSRAAALAGDLVAGALKRDTNAGIYNEEYQIFRSFALASLDIVKGELILVLFPVFVHCYVGLVRQGFSVEARQFWVAWEGDHIDRFPDELRTMSMLTAPEQLETAVFMAANPFIAQALSHRFTMRICTFSYGLLTNFVVHNNLLLVASILNDHIAFHKVADVMAAPSADGNGGAGAGAMFASIDALRLGDGTDGVSLPLGYLHHRQHAADVRNLPLYAPGKGMGIDGVTELRDDPLYSEWLYRIVLPRVFLGGNVLGKGPAEKLRREDSGVDRGDGDKKKAARFHPSAGSSSGSSAGSSSGNALDPSVIFSTITNAHEGMTCLHISRGVTQAAAGFKDSCVRVWRLDDDTGATFGHLLPGAAWSLKDVYPRPPRVRSAGSSSSSSSSSNNGGGAGAYENGDGAAATTAAGGRGAKSGAAVRPLLELWGHSKAVYAVCQCQESGTGRRDDARLVLSSSADEDIRLWDTAVAQCVGKYASGDVRLGPAWGLAFSPLGSGYYFAAAHHCMAAAVYCTDRLIPLRMLTGHVSDVNAVCWHENATLVATCSDDRTARLFDIRTGRCVRTFGGSPSALSSVALTAFAASGGVAGLLAAGGDTGAVTLWDVGSERRVGTFGGHVGPVHSLAFNADASALATGGADCSVRVYDVKAAMAAVPGASTTAPVPSPSSSSAAAALPTALGALTTLLPPRHSFYTKFSPVFFLNYTDKNLLYAGGPFSLDRAVTEAAGTATEHETASMLGLSQAVIGM